LAAKALYVADGHHRYETALAYQEERDQCHSKREEAFNYVMMTLVDFSDPGLVNLPVCRLVRGIAPSALAGLKKQLENFFTLESISLPQDLLASYHCEPKVQTEQRGGETTSKIIDKAILVILGLEPQSLVVLTPRPDVSIEAMMPANRSRVYKTFELSILNHVILDKIMGVIDCHSEGMHQSNVAASRSSDGSQETATRTRSEGGDPRVSYTVDIGEAYQQVKEGKYQLAFLLNPPRPEIIKAVVEAGDRLPPKSTYFYPKVPAGLVFNSLD